MEPQNLELYNTEMGPSTQFINVVLIYTNSIYLHQPPIFPHLSYSQRCCHLSLFLTPSHSIILLLHFLFYCTTSDYTTISMLFCNCHCIDCCIYCLPHEIHTNLEFYCTRILNLSAPPVAFQTWLMGMLEGKGINDECRIGINGCCRLSGLKSLF